MSVGGGASEEAILRRLMDLGRLSRPEFDTRVIELHKSYELFRQARRGKSKGGPAPYVMQLGTEEERSFDRYSMPMPRVISICLK